MHYIWNIISLRLRLIYRNQATLLLTLITMVIFVALTGSLYEHQEESVQIPIAYVDNDQTVFSREFLLNVHQNELLRVTEMELSKGIQAIKDGKIQLLFVIHQGAMKSIEDGEFEGLMDIYYIAENYVSPLIGDVVVGEMLEEVCLKTAVNYLEQALAGRATDETLEAAYQYGQSLTGERKVNYYVRIEYVQLDSGNVIDQEKIAQTLVFKQMIFGVMLSFIAFYALFSAIHIVKDEEMCLSSKITISKTKSWILTLGNYGGIVISTGCMILLAAGINAFYSDTKLLTFFSNLLILLLYDLVISAIVLVLATIFKQISGFIVIGASLILVMGIISGSFFNIDLAIPEIKGIAGLTPAYYALKNLIGMIVEGNMSDLRELIRYHLVALGILSIIQVVLTNRKNV